MAVGVRERGAFNKTIWIQRISRWMPKEREDSFHTAYASTPPPTKQQTKFKKKQKTSMYKTEAPENHTKKEFAC